MENNETPEEDEVDLTIHDWNMFKSGLEIFYGKDYKKEMHGVLSWLTTNLKE